MPTSKYDHLFGGKPGAAEEAKRSMRRTYGRTKGDQVFFATITRREHKQKRARKAKR
jgi:hypothetical protein